MRRWIAALLALVALVAPSLAQEGATPWQAVVTGQIEAFRAEDGVAALTFAGTGFKAQFADQPEMFYEAIIAAGYGPIVMSRSHSFGTFKQVSDTAVLQVVNLVGRDQSLYEALYQLSEEPDEGWRVQGVVLRKTEGVGI